MKWIATALLVGVFVAHDSANWLSQGSRFTPAAWFYMLQGAWSVALSATILLMLEAARPTIWRNLAQAAMVISIVEGAQIPVCRAILMGPPAAGMNVCDSATGLPVGAVLTCIEIIALCWAVAAWAWGGENA